MRTFSVLLLWILLSCSRDTGKLSRTLQSAVDDEKLSAKKKIQIEEEYLRIQDDSLASVYAKRIIALIESGGDSTHIEVARRALLKTPAKNH